MSTSRRNLSIASFAALGLGAALIAAPAEAHAAGGATLSVAAVSETMDPAISRARELEYATCVKLVNYQGARLIPEAAVGFPRISRDGRTYTFTIRRGFRFYPGGKRLTAADFAWVVYRATVRPTGAPPEEPTGASPFLDVVGARRVAAGAPRSALAGARASGARLALTLVRPAADLLLRLAAPYACALPVGTPRPDRGITAPVPSAGPYYAASVDPDKGIVLRRNPLYGGARPRHFPVIRTRPDETPVADADLVHLRRVDVPSALPRVRTGLRPAVAYLALNWNRPLFAGNSQLARAVAYAVDRRALVRAEGPLAGVPTDDLIPLSLPGRRGRPIYPLSGALGRARALAVGHTRDGDVRIVSCYRSDDAAAAVVAAELQAIGLVPTVVQLNCSFAMAYPIDADILLTVWAADDPRDQSVVADPYSFARELDPVFFLRDIVAGTPFNHGAGPLVNFTDPVWTRRIARVLALPPGRRARAADTLERRLMREVVPAVPYMNPYDPVRLSSRVGCFRYQPGYGVDLAALCPR